MTTRNTNLPLPVGSAPELAGAELAPLLTEPFARAWNEPVVARPGAQALRARLLGRLAASREAETVMFTSRRRRLPSQVLADGVVVQTLYMAQAGQAPRPGEPLRARLLELAAGTQLAPGLLGSETELKSRHREWLVVSGSVQFGSEVLSQRDYHVTPAGQDTPALKCATTALLFLRECDLASAQGDTPTTVRDEQAGWPDFAPGIQRRVLWQRNGAAAFLYYAQPGAQVPHHTHGHDEECLMVQGELFLDDVLLQPGDYQLAPAGSGHHITETDTGVVIYAHGDLDLQFVA